jgi:hypothetical protein
MKIKTNLSPRVLSKIAKGISIAADKQRQRPYVPENNAESELLRKADSAFDTMLNSLQEDVAALLLDKE